MSKSNRSRGGFTLVELLVVIAILGILMGLIVAGVAKFRAAAWKASTQNELNTIAGAIQTYYSTFHAYPGPLPNSDLGPTVTSYSNPITVDTSASAQGFEASGNLTSITATENLVLGLYGGLKNTSLSATPMIVYDPRLVGQGPKGLNYQNAKQYQGFLTDQSLLGWRQGPNGKTGHFQDDAGAANDSLVPELVDRFPEGMPILYMRAKAGARVGYPSPTNALNGVVTDPTNPSTAQYQLQDILGYTATTIGEGKSLNRGQQFMNGTTAVSTPPYYHGLKTVNVSASLDKTAGANYFYPYDAYPYLSHPTMADTPRQKDGFILISPGPDRIYGTEDDITSFGDVGQ